ncbi:MAG: LemA family protein [Bacilli bacterium]|nr:LemA family protein [Bacilli bacterium]
MTVVTMSIIAFIIIIIAALITIIISKYNNIQNYIIRIEEAENNIDSVLRKKYDLLNESINIIQNETENKNKIMENITNIKKDELSSFELDRKLTDGTKEFNKYKDQYPSLSNNETFSKIQIELNETEAETNAYKKYYNDLITEYNKLVKTFPTVIISIIFKFKKKLYFDGKDMGDDNIKDFKL